MLLAYNHLNGSSGIQAIVVRRQTFPCKYQLSEHDIRTACIPPEKHSLIVKPQRMAASQQAPAHSNGHPVSDRVHYTGGYLSYEFIRNPDPVDSRQHPYISDVSAENKLQEVLSRSGVGTTPSDSLEIAKVKSTSFLPCQLRISSLLTKISHLWLMP